MKSILRIFGLSLILLASVGPSEADDCFQEAFLAALRAYPRLRDGANLRAWILRIATNKAIDMARARRRRPEPREEAAELADPRTVPEPAGADPDDPLWERVRELPPRQRTAVVHRHVLDRSYAEIAELMGCSEQTARANVHQGMKKLREVVQA